MEASSEVSPTASWDTVMVSLAVPAVMVTLPLRPAGASFFCTVSLRVTVPAAPLVLSREKNSEPESAFASADQSVLVVKTTSKV